MHWSHAPVFDRQTPPVTFLREKPQESRQHQMTCRYFLKILCLFKIKQLKTSRLIILIKQKKHANMSLRPLHWVQHKFDAVFHTFFCESGKSILQVSSYA